MGTLDFHLEFQSEIEHLDEALIAEADERLRALTEDHDDLIGASVAMEELSAGQTPHAYQARVVVYIRPENIVAVEKGDTPETALKDALGAVERQVRERRDRLRKPWA